MNQNLIIPPPLPWQKDQQNSSTPHRDSDYRPNALPLPGTAYYNLISRVDSGTNRTARIYMWPRLLTLSNSLVSKRLIRFANSKNELKFVDAPPPDQNSLPSDHSLRDTYNTLETTIRQIHRVSQLEVVRPDYIVNDVDRIGDVIVEHDRYQQFIDNLQYGAGRLADRQDRRFARRQGELRSQFMWLNDFKSSIADCLDEMGAIENWLLSQIGNHDMLRRQAMTAVSMIEKNS